jgi:hypothetical protein
MEEFSLLDGVIDIYKLEAAVREDPLELLPVKYQGMTNEDMSMLRIAISVLGKRQYEECHSGNSIVAATTSEIRKQLASYWEYNQIGL